VTRCSRPTPAGSVRSTRSVLDETLFNRAGPWRTQQWATSIVNVGGAGRAAQLIDIVPGRSATPVLDWLEDQSPEWKQAIR
jgi:hypothetical protein